MAPTSMADSHEDANDSTPREEQHGRQHESRQAVPTCRSPDGNSTTHFFATVFGRRLEEPLPSKEADMSYYDAPRPSPPVSDPPHTPHTSVTMQVEANGQPLHGVADRTQPVRVPHEARRLGRWMVRENRKQGAAGRLFRPGFVVAVVGLAITEAMGAMGWLPPVRPGTWLQDAVNLAAVPFRGMSTGTPVWPWTWLQGVVNLTVAPFQWMFTGTVWLAGQAAAAWLTPSGWLGAAAALLLGFPSPAEGAEVMDEKLQEEKRRARIRRLGRSPADVKDLARRLEMLADEYDLTLTVAVSDTTLTIEFDGAETRVVRRTTTKPVRNIKAAQPWTVPSVS